MKLVAIYSATKEVFGYPEVMFRWVVWSRNEPFDHKALCPDFDEGSDHEKWWAVNVLDNLFTQEEAKMLLEDLKLRENTKVEAYMHEFPKPRNVILDWADSRPSSDAMYWMYEETNYNLPFRVSGCCYHRE